MRMRMYWGSSGLFLIFPILRSYLTALLHRAKLATTQPNGRRILRNLKSTLFESCYENHAPTCRGDCCAGHRQFMASCPGLPIAPTRTQWHWKPDDAQRKSSTFGGCFCAGGLNALAGFLFVSSFVAGDVARRGTG
jgi:hypothetical protein